MNSATRTPINGKPVPTGLQPQERLLLMACSGTKTATPNGLQLAPVDLYAPGSMHQILHRWMPRLDQAEIRILSAKHRLLTDQWPKLTGYDERMSQEKADHLIRGGIFAPHDGFGGFRRGSARGSAPACYLRPSSGFVYKDVYIAAGAEYRRVFHHWVIEMQLKGMIAPDAAINEVTGGIGEQRGQLAAYLRGITRNDVELQVAA